MIVPLVFDRINVLQFKLILFSFGSVNGPLNAVHAKTFDNRWLCAKLQVAIIAIASY